MVHLWTKTLTAEAARVGSLILKVPPPLDCTSGLE
jgi:hypothetical protein